MIRPDTSQPSWASFHTSPQATVPKVIQTSEEASRPRADNTGAETVAAMSLPEVNPEPEPMQIVISTLNAPADSRDSAALPIIIAVGALLLILVLTLLLRPYVTD